MSKALVIVESPTKVKTINKILGPKYKVVSSMGHLIDLPRSTFGVDIEKDFEPKFIIVRDKQKILTQLKKEAKTKKEIFVATDPDREGEAIGWNIIQHIATDGQKVFRVTFQEITKEAVLKAFQTPRQFDSKKVDAQVARRVLDRIVGYKISPLLWKKVGSRLSAGRVQSVALRLIVDREREIKNFVPQEYWQIAVDLQKTGIKDILTAQLEKIDGQKFELKNKSESETLVEEIKKQQFNVSGIIEREVKRNPSPPFITSTLQQEAFNKLGFNANKTMMIAQELYEGMDVGGETIGLITYMRTDSVNISQDALSKVRQYIGKNYGDKYLPSTPNTYKSRKSAQEAHEAIRPSEIGLKPDDIKQYLSADQFKLYELIWRRFVACQMMPAVYLNRKIEIAAGRFQFGVAGSKLIFDGFLALDESAKEEDEAKQDLTPYQKDDSLKLLEVKPTQHFTKPPPRFSEASLVRALEEQGIGRPSTYASIISTLVFRNYVMRERGYFMATELGMTICDLLVEYFSKIMDIGFTAKMEEHLDLIEEGELAYIQLLKEFYEPFHQELEYAMRTIEKTEMTVDEVCPQCGRQMVIKWGRRGKFLSCSGFPECKYAKAFTTGIKCPQPDCGGELIKRRSRQGRSFYGCSHYPKCTFVANKLPEAAPGPAQP